MPAPSFASPASPRKRSIHEVDGATLPSVGPKRALTTYIENNQENHDPTSGPQKEATELDDKDLTTIQPSPQVVIPVKTPDQSPVARTIETTLVPSTTGEPNQGSPVKSDMNASKKRKLSPASKEVKDKQRLEEKAKKDEEKKKREEEKRLKEEEKKKRDAEREEEKRLKEDERKKREAEREEKKKAKEEEKAAKEVAKEDDKRRKEEAKLKKERV